jgi:hypothetical protein
VPNILGRPLGFTDDIELTALTEAESPDISTRDRLRCLATAMMARAQKTALLRDLAYWRPFERTGATCRRAT